MSSSHDSDQPSPGHSDSSAYYKSPGSFELGPEDEPRSPIRSRAGLSPTGVFSWLVIGGMTVLMMFLATIETESELDKKNPKAPPVPASNEIGSFVSQGKWIVYPKASAELARSKAATDDEKSEKPASKERKATYLVPDNMDHGSLAQRWGVSVLKNELEGAEEAEKYLATTEKRLEESGLEMTDEQKKLHQSLKNLYASYKNSDFEKSPITAEEQEQIKKELGWLGELALVPEGTSDIENRRRLLLETSSSIGVLGFALLIGAFLLFVGFVLLVGMAIAAFAGKLARKFGRSETDPNVYAETFAIWMVLFMAGQLVLGLLMAVLEFNQEGWQTMAATLIPFFGSLAALIWPVIRGVSFSQVVSDIGLKSGTPVSDVLLALPSYLMMLPALFCSVILVAILFAITSDQSPENFGKSGAPSHPIQDLLKQGDPVTLVVVFLVACVAAPIVEETMFRGVLYRHLRSISQRWAVLISIVMACLINSFIFAAIHPQGILAIPLLMTLAIGFSIAREFRDSLWGPMVMHAINNFIVLSVSVLML